MKAQFLKNSVRFCGILGVAAAIQACKVQADFSGQAEDSEITEDGEALMLLGTEGNKNNSIRRIHYLSTQGMYRPGVSTNEDPVSSDGVRVSTSPPREPDEDQQIAPMVGNEELDLVVRGRKVLASYKSQNCQVSAEMDREDLIGLVQSVRDARKQRMNQGDERTIFIDAPEKIMTVERLRGAALVYHLNQMSGISPGLPYPIDLQPEPGVAASMRNDSAALTLRDERHFVVEDSTEILEEVAFLVKEITKREKCSQPRKTISEVQFILTRNNSNRTQFKHVNLVVKLLGQGKVSIYGKILNKEPGTESCSENIDMKLDNQVLAEATSIIEMEKADSICAMAPDVKGISKDKNLGIVYQNGQTVTGGFDCTYSNRVKKNERFLEVLKSLVQPKVTCLKESIYL